VTGVHPCVPVRSLALAAALLAVAVPAVEARRPALGLADDLAFADSRPGPRLAAFRTARATGARTVRLTLDWSAVAPGGASKPAGFDAADPASPLYKWGYIEDAVRDAADSDLRVVLTVVRAPRWAEGAPRPRSAAPGTWRPDRRELGRFVRAAARRFSGFFPDPKQSGDGLTTPGRSLPAVRYWQIWDEPNRPSGLRPSTPDHYRSLLNQGARAVRRVSHENVVVAGGTAPGGAVAFWRRFLCQNAAGCQTQPDFDVLAHHPVDGRTPIASRLLARLGRVLRRARGRRAGIWLTDLRWPTPPLAPRGVSVRRAARNLRISLRRAAAQPRVRLVVWEGLQDRRTYLPGRFPTIASGLYERGDDIASAAPKPALHAFRSFLR
jgi:hypothetical protein